MNVSVFFPTGEGGRSAFAQVGNPERGLDGIAADFFSVEDGGVGTFTALESALSFFVDERRMGGVWFSSVCVVFGFASGFPFFVVSEKKSFGSSFAERKQTFSFRIFTRKGERQKNGTAVTEIRACRR